MEEQGVVVHPLLTKIAKIRINDWDWDIDIDDILQIRYDNIFGEIITIPVLENRVGRLASELREYKKELQLRLDLKEAEIRKLVRNKYAADGLKKPTIQEIDDNLILDPVIKNLRLNLIRVEKDLEDIEIFYDAVKSKAFKLNNLSKNISPEEFDKELLEGRINNVMITLNKRRYGS